VQLAPTTTTFTITMPTAETGTGATNDGTLDSKPYYKVGPLLQAFGFGWGTALLQSWSFTTSIRFWLGYSSLGWIDLGYT